MIAGAAFAVVAGVTGRISYTHIEALTLTLHQDPGNARLMPFGVDGLIVVGSVALLQASDEYWWLGWVCVIPGALVSLVANVASGWRYGWPSAAWAGVASLAFALATFTLERWLKSQFREDEDEGAEVPHPSGETAHPLTTTEALQALLKSESQAQLAFILGVDRNKIRAWDTRLEAAAEETGDPEPAAEPVSLARVNGSAP